MEHSIKFKNAKVYYSVEGKGTTIVFIHGFLENKSMWQSITPHLTLRNRVVGIDLPGHGKSDCIGYMHSMELLAESVDAVLKQLRIRKCILVGHSLGGYVALAFAEQYPNKIKGICLMNSNAFGDSEERVKIRNRAISLVQKQHENLIRMSFLNLFDSKIKHEIKEERDAALQDALKTSVQGYIAMQEGMKIRPNRSKILRLADFKKLYIIGEKDSILDFKISLQEAKDNKAAAVLFPNGHMSHIENTKEVIKVLVDFVKGL